MAEDKVKVSGKSPSLWSVKIDGVWTKFKDLSSLAQLVGEIDGRELGEVKIRYQNSSGQWVKIVDLGTKFIVTFRLKDDSEECLDDPPRQV
jgi:hypothetical protein